MLEHCGIVGFFYFRIALHLRSVGYNLYKAGGSDDGNSHNGTMYTYICSVVSHLFYMLHLLLHQILCLVVLLAC